jgi:hypothetical protein
MISKTFEQTSDTDMTLSDLEAFCRTAREQGGSDDDRLRVRTSFRGAVRTLRLLITMEHNREAAHRRDQQR